MLTRTTEQPFPLRRRTVNLRTTGSYLNYSTTGLIHCSLCLTAYFSTNSYLLGLDGHLVLFLSICQPCTSSFLCVLCILFRRLCSGLENFIKTIFSNRLYLNGDEVKTFARHGHLNAIQCLAPPSPAFIFDVTAQVDDVHGHRIPSLYQV